ncbi:MAG: Gfo/Idh/MocA family oxidoreductase, partial [Alphaproteobacteria bacterium]
MYIYQELAARAAAGKPVRVGLIGAGKFGSMFLSQVPTTPGLEVAVIADLSPDGAKKACRNVGWPDELIARTKFVDDAMAMMQAGGVDVVVEATGNPVVGLVHAREAIRNGIHIVMVNVEAD